MTDTDGTEYEVLLIGGRSAGGRTSVGYEVSDRLQAAGIAHCLVGGGQSRRRHPKAVDDPNGTTLTATNLTALWRNYSAIGHRRLIYVNTACVLEHKMIVRSMGGGARATYLDSAAESWIARIATDRRAVADVAADVVEATAWTSSPAR